MCKQTTNGNRKSCFSFLLLFDSAYLNDYSSLHLSFNPLSIVFFSGNFFFLSLGKWKEFDFDIFVFSCQPHAPGVCVSLSCVRDVSYWERACSLPMQMHADQSISWRVGSGKDDQMRREDFHVVQISCFPSESQQKTKQIKLET
jgi:hypothetical protein